MFHSKAFIACLHFIFISLATTFPQRESQLKICGYKSCNPVKEGMINVHLVPHTHDDVGWLKTVDQYYYGAKTKIQNAGVQYILDSVIQELLKDPSRRFIYVEMAFFWRWWHEQSNNMKHVVQNLVNEGRLEFILGGWCMNDEATTHYSAIIDQHTLGFDVLSSIFGDCARPRVAWQIDPFGHSKEMASLFAQMGFDGLFFGRADYQDIFNRFLKKQLEMVWKANKNLGDTADLFTGVLLNGYNPPPGFCFDELCTDDPIMDDRRLGEYNLDAKIDLFTLWVKFQSLSLKTTHIMLTMGSDFQYSNANAWFKNMDKLMYHINQRQSNGSKLNLLYSTPSCYLYHVNKANVTWTQKTDDFFPYADRPNSFWTGYFTSRPSLKKYVRDTSSFFQTCRHLDVFGELYNHIQIFRLWDALSIAQHHDAVSGTEKQAVANDYALRLSVGTHGCQSVLNAAYKKMMPKTQTVFPDQLFCPLLNISSCYATENMKEFTLTMYNPLAQDVADYIRLPVYSDSYIVYGPNLKPISSQVISIDTATKRIPERGESIANYELIFQFQIPSLGFATFFIQTNKNKNKETTSKVTSIQQGEDFELNNGLVSISFDAATARMKKFGNLQSNIFTTLKQNYLYYIGHAGNNSNPDVQASNNYIFRPVNDVPTSISGGTHVKTLLIKGNCVQEVHQVFSPWVTQSVRLYKGQNYVEVEWTVGPIPIHDKQGKEIIVRYDSDQNTNKTFYTDANGRQILERRLNYRPTWSLQQSEPVAGNYFPINTKMFIRDVNKDIQLTLLTDRSQGGSSLQDGQMELMLHRRLLFDDGRGVGEPLNETGVDGCGLIVRGKHYIYLDRKEPSTVFHRQQAVEIFFKPTVSFSELKTSPQNWSSIFHTQWQAIKSHVPPNVNLLTLQQWGRHKLLIRLEHIFEKNEGPLSKPATISLSDFFISYNITSVEEMVLGANLKLSDLHRLKWHTNNKFPDVHIKSHHSLNVTLYPMEIRTFIVVFNKGK